METHARRSSLVGPVALIAIGFLFLLNNLGLLGWDVWPAVLRLWPALLIGIGVELVIDRRSLAASLLTVAILVVLLGVAVWPFVGRATATKGVTIEQVSQPLDGALRAEVEIKATVSDLRLSALPPDEGDGPVILIEGEVTVPSSARTAQNASRSGDTLYYALRSEGIEPLTPWRSGKSTWGDLSWDLRLNRQVPTKLRLNTGVGRAVVDLGRTNISSLQAVTGVGEATITLPRQGNLDARIEAGIGRVTVIVPQGMAARITLHRGLGDVDIRGDYQRSGDVYTSPGYAMAANRVELDVKCGIGEMIIR